MVPSSRENLNRKALFLPSNIGVACFFSLNQSNDSAQWCPMLHLNTLGITWNRGKIRISSHSMSREITAQHHLDVCVCVSGTSKNWMIYIESLQLTGWRFPIHESTGVTPQLSSICLWIVHVFHHPLLGVSPNINIYGSMALHSLRGIAATPDVLWPAEAAPNASCRRFRRCLSTVEMGQWWPVAGPSLEK